MQQQTNTDEPAIARRRWPGYWITGTGRIAVVFRCCHRIELVDFVLVAREKVAGSCGVQCDAAENPKMHAAFYLDEVPRKEIPHRSMRRLPGWDD